MQPQTHERLFNLKKDKKESFDSVVSRLLDMDDKYTSKVEEYEYEYLVGEKSKLFRVIYSDTILIEYWNSSVFKFEKNIRAWQHGEKLSESEIDSFIRFIVMESNLYVLYEMGDDLTQNDVHIKRV